MKLKELERLQKGKDLVVGWTKPETIDTDYDDDEVG